MLEILPLDVLDSHRKTELVKLLQDAVHGGASVGFLAPLSEDTALLYWQSVFEMVGKGLIPFIATQNGAVVGSVQLALCMKENGRHRAEIQKLFVLSSHRGHGIARKLMEAAEAEAAKHGISLLVLDTEAGSAAESVYQRLGWKKSGEIPDYALSPDGRLHPTACYFKQL